ncbi:MAG: SIR2 family protein [Bacteroidota bacterium]
MVEIANELKEAIQNDKLILFVGSGLSKKFGFPDWSNLVINILKKIGGSKTKFIPIIEEKEMSALEVLGKLEQDHKTEVIRVVEETFSSFPSETNLDFHRKLLNLSSKIITTNYDMAFEKSTDDLYTVSNFDAYKIAQLKDKNKFLFKIHGCISSPSNCTLFPSQYEVLYSNNEKATIFKLKSFLEENTLLFLGYSMNDPEITNILNNINVMFEDHSPKHFIISTDIFNSNKFIKNFPYPHLESYDRLEEIIDYLIEFKKKDAQISDLKIKRDNLGSFDFAKAIEVFNQEDRNLSYSSTKEDIARVKQIKAQIIKDIFSQSDEKIEFISSKNTLMLSSLYFDSIYTSPKLNEGLISEIQKVRHDDEKFQWYDRSIIVSGLTLSLIHHEFDIQKANLLLDFVTNFEEGVWEKALTGIILSIILQKNRRWKKSPLFLKRLESLQSNEKIQTGIICIDFILKNELYKECLFDPSIYNIDLFSNPMNCFVPFFENNEIFKDALVNSKSDFDIEYFKNYITILPLIDCYKYALCTLLSKNNIKTRKLEGKDKERFIEKNSISSVLNPYQNILGTLYNFFTYYPNELVYNVFKKQLLLTRTDLRTIVLDKTNQLLLEANTLYSEDRYKEAIVKYDDLLRIDNTNEEALIQKANCYYDLRNYKESLNLYLKIKTQKTNVSSIDFKIADCYNEIKEYQESLKYCEELLKNDFFHNYILFALISNNYSELNDSENAIKYISMCEKCAVSKDEKLNIAIVYETHDRFEDGKRVIDEILELDPKNSSAWDILGSIHMHLFEWDLAKEAMQNAEDFDKKDNSYELNKARLLLFSQKNIDEPKNIFEKLINVKENYKDVAYGNLGHYYLINDNKELAFNNYLNSLRSMKDEKEFLKKMQIDLKFILNLGVNKEVYFSIRDEVIKKYHSDINNK